MVQVYSRLTFSSAPCTTFSFSSVITFLPVYYLAYAEAPGRPAPLFWKRNWICMKYAHTKLHLTLGGGNMWQSPLPEMIVLRKMLDDDDVDEVFFCAEIEYQKDRGLDFLCIFTPVLVPVSFSRSRTFCRWKQRRVNTKIFLLLLQKLDF